MYCSLSGVPPNQPVVSVKSGHIFERSLIEAHISEKGVCPITAQPLAKADLLPVTSALTPRPRPSATTTFPGLLGAMQTEWDSLMLEHFELRTYVEKLRLDLSKHKYQYDAACRVITRLTQERDAARSAMIDSGGGGGGRNNKEALAAYTATLDSVFEKLSQARRTRTVTKHGVGAVEGLEEVDCFAFHSKNTLSGVLCVAISATGDRILTGGVDGTAVLSERGSGRPMAVFTGHTGPIRAVCASDAGGFLSASDDGSIRVWLGVSPYAPPGPVFRVHSGPVVGLAVHPGSSYFYSGGAEDGKVGIHCSETCRTLAMPIVAGPVAALACHPDGRQIAAATGQDVTFFDTRDISLQTITSTVSHSSGADISGIACSQNGYQVATGARDGTVVLWDLRKNPSQGLETWTHIGGEIQSLAFDASGMMLACGAKDGTVTVIHNSKPWTRSHRVVGKHDGPCTGVVFEDSSRMSRSSSSTPVPWLVSVSLDGFLKVFTTAK